MLVPVAFVIVVLVWSSTPLALKFSSEGISFIDAAFLRMAAGGLLSYVLIKALRIPLPWDKPALRQYLIVCIGLYAGMLTAYWAVLWIPSGLLSVMFGLSPLFNGILAIYVLKENSLNATRLAALAVALAGLGLVFSEQLQAGSMSLYGLLVALLSVFFWALSSVYLKRYNTNLHPLAQTTGGLLMVTPLYGLTHFAMGCEITSDISTNAILAISYLAVFGSVIGFLSYYYILQKIPVDKAALSTLITPILALMLGQWLAGETVSLNALTGVALVLVALLFYQWPKLINQLLTRSPD